MRDGVCIEWAVHADSRDRFQDSVRTKWNASCPDLIGASTCGRDTYLAIALWEVLVLPRSTSLVVMLYRLWDIHTPGASCIVGKPQYRPNVSDGFSSEDRGLRCLSWSDVEEVPNSAGGGGAAGPATSPTQCHHDAITSLEVSLDDIGLLFDRLLRRAGAFDT